MRRITVLISSWMICSLFLLGSASAYPIREGDWIKFGWDGTQGHAEGGGEFAVYKGGVKLFETFCLERDEYITLGTSYLVGHITEAAVLGGKNPIPSPDPIDPKTGYLYYKYITGGLTGYIDDNVHANALQETIWYIEDEYYPNSHLLSPIAQQFYDDANSNAGNSLWDVKVLNMFTGYDAHGIPTGYIQDQLVYEPVPEPMTILLVGGGILSLAVRLRRGKK